jgi:hypothetical protein
VPGRDDVDADVAKRGQRAVLADRDEPAEAAPGDVLEEDAFDRILGAEGEGLAQRRLERAAHVYPPLYSV